MFKEITTLQKALYDVRHEHITGDEFGDIARKIIYNYGVRMNNNGDFVVKGLANKIRFDLFILIYRMSYPVSFFVNSIFKKH